MRIKYCDMKINRLKIVLAEKEKTNKWLANKLGKSESTISRWCTNEIQPSLGIMTQIAYLLNIDIKELLNSTK